MRPSDRGRTGEERAATYLEGRGFEILKKRFRGGGGEVDIIAREGEVLVFVEVKTRRFLDMDELERSLDWRKRSRIERASLHFLDQLGLETDRTKVRFDCILIDGSRLVHLPGAWEHDG